MDPAYERRALLTYNYVRLIVAAPAALLLVTMIFWAFSGAEIETSISGYYATPVRDVFVGAMVATALCMIVYQGTSRLEDYSLNLMGFFAVFVALVPTNLADIRGDLPDGERAELLDGLRGSLIAALLTFVGFGVLDFWKVKRKDWRGLFTNHGRWRRAAVGIMTIGCSGFIVLLLWRLSEHEDYGWIHNYAAVALVACLAVAVSSHAWPDQTSTDEETAEDMCPTAERGRYKGIVFAMIGAGLLFVFLKLVVKWDHSILAVEIAEIVLFFVFWTLETKRLWYPPPPPVPGRLAARGRKSD